MKVSGVYKITNLETNEYYIGSSVDVKKRWTTHKCSSFWKRYTNNKLYIAFQQYGLDKFKFEIIEETDNLKEREQYYIDLLKPIYNDRKANGLDLERRKECKQSEKYKKYNKEYQNQLCNYKGETLTLCALSTRFLRTGMHHPVLEAKKYLLNQ